jgi:rfaE bifunctional protein kinase chain/domain
MKPERFHEITAQYSRLHIGILGDFFLDRYLEIDPVRHETSIETGRTVHNVVAVRAQPGAAGTILNNLVALGIGEIVPISFCGDDGEGYELRRALVPRAGVNLEHFITTPDRRTPVYCKPIIMEPDGPPRELERLDFKNWTRTPPELESDLAARAEQVSGRLDALLVLDQVDVINTGVVTRVVKDAVQRILDANRELIVLADSRVGLLKFPPCCYKMNAAELARISGTFDTGPDAVQAQAAAIAARTGRLVFVTMAERGMVGASPDGHTEHMPARPVHGPIDIVGAGDAVTANLAAALAARASLHEAMELATAAASIVIHQLGTTGTASVLELWRLASDK